MARGALDLHVDIDKAMLKLGRIPDDVRASLKTEIDALAVRLRDQVKSNASVWQVRSGKFIGSIKKSVRTSKTSVVGRVYSNDPVAHLLEKGVKPHDIRAVNATTLAFLSYFGAGGFAKMVKHPGFAGHAIFSEAFFDMLGDIKEEVTETVRQAAGHAGEAAA